MCILPCVLGGAVLNPDLVKSNLDGPGLGENPRRGKARMSFLINRATERSNHRENNRPGEVTTPGL